MEAHTSKPLPADPTKVAVAAMAAEIVRLEKELAEVKAAHESTVADLKAKLSAAEQENLGLQQNVAWLEGRTCAD
eukprot:gene1823-14264_t